MLIPNKYNVVTEGEFLISGITVKYSKLTEKETESFLAPAMEAGVVIGDDIIFKGTAVVGGTELEMYIFLGPYLMEKCNEQPRIDFLEHGFKVELARGGHIQYALAPPPTG